MMYKKLPSSPFVSTNEGLELEQAFGVLTCDIWIFFFTHNHRHKPDYDD